VHEKVASNTVSVKFNRKMENKRQQMERNGKKWKGSSNTVINGPPYTVINGDLRPSIHDGY
jgi:hypothetical protein